MWSLGQSCKKTVPFIPVPGPVPWFSYFFVPAPIPVPTLLLIRVPDPVPVP